MEEIRGKEVYENCVVCLDLFVRITHVQNYSLDSRILCLCPGKKKKRKKVARRLKPHNRNTEVSGTSV